MSELYLRNRQRVRPVNLRLWRRVAAWLVAQTCPGESRLGVLLVGAEEMTRLNEAFLRHRGSTDVIAFGYTTDEAQALHGEVFICVDEAIRQARRYGTTWQKEIVRYLAHGLLHFQGYRDGTAAERRKMKTVENVLVANLARQFSLSELSHRPKIHP